MTDLAAIVAVAVPILAAAVLSAVRSPRILPPVNAIAAVATVTAPLVLAFNVLSKPSQPLTGSWYVVDGAGAIFLIVIAVVGFLSAVASPSYLGVEKRGFFREGRAKGIYYAALYLFWATLIAVPIVDNLATAWVLIEATTSASAILVAFNGSRGALEAGWKYLALTSLGLAVALLGIVLLFAAVAQTDASFQALDWQRLHAQAASVNPDQALLALVLILTGLAAKIGWAPVHNWLPDAHSQAPPPVSALLSSALLPTVMLVAWRTQTCMQPAVDGSGFSMFLAFGLVSVAFAVPFLWRPQPLKRLLAYSSLEHMGILALGIGFANPLATIGVVIHIAGHALAKSLGFFTAIPLLKDDRSLENRPLHALARSNKTAAAAVGVSLVSLGDLPPSPLFFSEVLILFGGIASGHLAIVVVATILIALGFLGLAHATIEGIVGESTDVGSQRPFDPKLGALVIVTTIGLVGISAAAFALDGSQFIHEIMSAVT